MNTSTHFGGLGVMPSSDDMRIPSDLKLVERAVRAGWDVPEGTRRRVVEECDRIIRDCPDLRTRIGAMRVLAIVDGIDARREGQASKERIAQTPKVVLNLFQEIRDYARSVGELPDGAVPADGTGQPVDTGSTSPAAPEAGAVPER